MRYHLLIQSFPQNQESPALCTTQALMASGQSIKQIFFYFNGIENVLDMTLAAKWDKLIQLNIPLKLCKTSWEITNNGLPPNGFILSSLVDFFTQHWQDQGILLQL